MSQDRFAMADLTGGETNALVKMVGGSDVVKQILRGERTITVAFKEEASRMVLAALLEEVPDSSIDLLPIERFVAAEKFKVDRNGELPISYLGDNFKANFLGVVEENVPTMTVKQRKLLKSSVDRPILAALGDEDLAKIERARVALAHVFNYLKTADRNLWFIFYVPAKDGTVWAVNAYWRGHGWNVGAGSVSNPGGWGADFRVVSG